MFADFDNLCMYLNERFLITAEQVSIATLANIWLVLEFLAALSNSFMLSL